MIRSFGICREYGLIFGVYASNIASGLRSLDEDLVACDTPNFTDDTCFYYRFYQGF